MSQNKNKPNKNAGTLGPEKYLESPYRQKSLNDPDNPYRWENLNSTNRPNEYNLDIDNR